MSDIEKNFIDLAPYLEALLFVSPEPVLPSQLAIALNVSVLAVEEGLKKLESDLRLRGLRLQKQAGRIQLTTSPELACHIDIFLGLETTSRLSRAALEALAIVAYQQPVTRPLIEEIRGVSSDGVMKSLLGKRLIQEIGRAETPGRPILYGTTVDFLQYFGITNLSELPSLSVSEAVNERSHDEALKG